MVNHIIECYRDSYQKARSQNAILASEQRTGLTNFDADDLLSTPFQTTDISEQVKSMTSGKADIVVEMQRVHNHNSLQWRIIKDKESYVAFGFADNEKPLSFDEAVATVMIDIHGMIRFAMVSDNGIITATEYKLDKDGEYRLKRAHVTSSDDAMGNQPFDSLNCGDFDLMYNAGVITKRMLQNSSNRKMIGIFQVGENSHYDCVHSQRDFNVNTSENNVEFAGHSFPILLPK